MTDRVTPVSLTSEEHTLTMLLITLAFLLPRGTNSSAEAAGPRLTCECCGAATGTFGAQLTAYRDACRATGAEAAFRAGFAASIDRLGDDLIIAASVFDSHADEAWAEYQTRPK